jgi:hypothetical protein
MDFFGAQDTIHDTKMFLKVVFDKTAFENVRLVVITVNKTLMKHIQND